MPSNSRARTIKDTDRPPSVVWIGGADRNAAERQIGPDGLAYSLHWAPLTDTGVYTVLEARPLLVIVETSKLTAPVKRLLASLEQARSELAFVIYLLRDKAPSTLKAPIDGFLLRRPGLAQQVRLVLGALEMAGRMRQQRDHARRRLRRMQQRIRRLNHLAVRDDLTTLYNLRFFNRTLDAEHSRAMRFRRRYSLIFIDLDGLREVNTEQGHLAGAHVLRRVGDFINRHIRRIDIPARVGGDEFVIICPETTKISTRIIAERLRAGIEDECTALTAGGSKKVTASMGVASFPEDGDLPESILERADRALYEAKAKGRNRVCCWGDFPEDLSIRKRGLVQTARPHEDPRKDAAKDTAAPDELEAGT